MDGSRERAARHKQRDLELAEEADAWGDEEDEHDQDDEEEDVDEYEWDDQDDEDDEDDYYADYYS